MRVTVAEDDLALGKFLTAALEGAGYSANRFGDGAAALEHVLAHAPDLLILDLGLPRMDGVDVLREVCRHTPETAVLVLTGRSLMAQKLECLNLGADDYILKPFSMQELLARCGAIGRRRASAGIGLLQHGGLKMDRITRAVTFEGEAIDLTGKEFTLLEYLLRQKGRAVSRRELLENVWQMSPDAGTNVVDVYVNYLRRKLLLAGSTDLIETVRGEGYAIGTGGTKLPLKKPVGSVTMSMLTAGAA